MAYLNFGQGTIGGKSVIGTINHFRDSVEEMRRLRAHMAAIGPLGLEGHPDFLVPVSALNTPAQDMNGQAFFDTIMQIIEPIIASAAATAEQQSRVARPA